MYRCTECNTEYTKCPEYCDCGNDTFEEIVEDSYEEEYYEPEPPVRRQPPRRKPRMSQEELEELEAEQLDKKKALITMAVSVVVAIILVTALPPYPQKKSAPAIKKAQVENVQIPDVNAYWDDTVASPFRKKDPNYNLPILNKHFGSISPVLRDYLISVGAEFTRQWDPNIVDGAGECKVEFTINKEGGLNTKKIAVRSNNESLDDSVLLLLSKLNSFDIPPDDYKGERIIIAFKIDKNRTSKVYYPMN